MTFPKAAAPGRAASTLRRLKRLAAQGRECALPAAAGVLMSFSLAPSPPFVAVPAMMLSLACVIMLFQRAQTIGRAALTGWAFGFGYFVVGLWWIGAAFDIVAQEVGWMKPFAQILLPAGMGLYWAAAFGAAAYAAWRLKFDPARRTGALVAIWSVVELARGWLLTGFPWGLVGYAWLDTPVAQLAAWIGPYGLTSATFALAALLAAALTASLRRDVRFALRAGGAWACLLLAFAAAGWSRLPSSPPDADGPLVRLVQPNIPQEEKGRRDLARAHADVLLALTAQPVAAPLEFVVWPEAASPYPIYADSRTRATYAQSVPGGAALVLGSLRRLPRTAPLRPAFHGNGPLGFGGRILQITLGSRYAQLDWWNSAFVLGAEGRLEHLYDKRHLVPFGEFLPLREFLEWAGLKTVSSAVLPGDGQGLLRLGEGRRALVLICYEAVFPRLAMTSSETRPDLILHLTNDGWFGVSGGPWQHLAQARRAIEQGFPSIDRRTQECLRQSILMAGSSRIWGCVSAA